MHLTNLWLRSIGPFDDTELQLVSGRKETPGAPVAFITGENGTGKTAIPDAIRLLFGEPYCHDVRDVLREPRNKKMTEHYVEGHFCLADGKKPRATYDSDLKGKGATFFRTLAYALRESDERKIHPEEHHNWVADYWDTSTDRDGFFSEELLGRSWNPTECLNNVLEGNYSNCKTVRLLCHASWMEGSKDDREHEFGRALWNKAGEIIRAVLANGGLTHVVRRTMTPMFVHNGQAVAVTGLGSGHNYLIGHMLQLLGQMYSVCLLREADPGSMCEVPGMLLIDNLGSNLHPKQQKRVLSLIRKFFPNVQVIATTHSPFVVSSVPEAQVFVCRWAGRSCIVEDVGKRYGNLPVDEVLMSEAFGETHPFNTEISKLIRKQKEAARSGDKERKLMIDSMLRKRNAQYFSYLDIEERMEELKRRSEGRENGQHR